MEIVFIRGGDRRTALLHRLAELDSLTDNELEIRLDQAHTVVRKCSVCGGSGWVKVKD